MRPKWILGVLAPLVWAACRPTNLEEQAVSEPAPPPAAAFAPVPEHLPLKAKLEVLDMRLEEALAAGLDEDAGMMRMLEVEALTDRIMETPPPVEWLAQAYDTEAKLRQLQALADRVVAQMRRGIVEGGVYADALELQRRARELRAALAVPGGGPPPPLDRLLAGTLDDSLAVVVGEGASGE
jgi:hypothetical protein